MIDKVIINVKAGRGGDGLSSFRRLKFKPKGGPDGGDGGAGGNVYFVVDHNMATLLDFRSKSDFNAQEGEKGGKNNMTGADGEDLVIKIPVGTLVFELTEEEQVLIGDMVGEDERSSKLLVANSGRGGKGNTRFKSSVNRAPTKFTKGRDGEKKEIVLEIKLVADVGLVGFPNAGKSTLINYLTNSNAKTANYPFTTLAPNLGPLKLNDETIILADIPGLIEGASEGKGLGDDFLRHIERTRIIVHMVDPMPLLVNEEEVGGVFENTFKLYETIRYELKNYGAGLEDKPEIVVINKIDVTEVKGVLEDIIKGFKSRGVDVIGISAVSGEGTDELLNKISEKLKTAPKRVVFDHGIKPIKIYTVDTLPNRRIIR